MWSWTNCSNPILSTKQNLENPFIDDMKAQVFLIKLVPSGCF